MKKFIQSESAVSESLSFALTLGIVLVSTALVFYGGVPIVEQSQKTTHFIEMERSFIFLSQNIDKVARESTPVRNTELKIKGGNFRISHDSSISVGDYNYELGSIEYYYDDKTVAYENGGIFTKYPAGEVVMVSRPTFSLGSVTGVSTIPALELVGESEISGDGVLRINSIHSTTSSPLQLIPRGDGNVSLIIKSNYYQGWAEYLNEIVNKTSGFCFEPDYLNSSIECSISSNFLNVDSDMILIKIED
jgi:hypothetical protein